MKKLSEVAILVDIKRQRIQEYEKAGIALKPKVKDKHGYWLYGEAEIERLWQIKFYRTLNLTVPKIKAIFADSNYNKHDAIADQIIKLEKQKKDLESMIEIARAYNEMDVLPSDAWVGRGNLLEKVQYNKVTPLIAKECSLFLEFIKQDDILDEELFDAFLIELSSEKAAKWIDAVEKIGRYYVTQVDYKACSVQKQVSIMIGIDAEVIPDSFLKCWLRTYCMVIKSEDDIKEAFGEDGCQYIEEAVEFYLQEQIKEYGNNFAKTPVCKILDNLQNYGLKHYTTGSIEVQSEVRKLHQMILQIGMFSEEAQIKMLAAFSDLFGSQEAKIALDNGGEKGISWFISRAIKIYCNHQQEAMEKAE